MSSRCRDGFFAGGAWMDALHLPAGKIDRRRQWARRHPVAHRENQDILSAEGGPSAGQNEHGAEKSAPCS